MTDFDGMLHVTKMIPNSVEVVHVGNLVLRTEYDAFGSVVLFEAFNPNTPPPQTLRVVSISGDPYVLPPPPVVDLGFVSPAAHLEKSSK